MRVGFSIIVMARTDIFKRIKNDKLIESRIQKYRLHYDYLKFCLENPNEFYGENDLYLNVHNYDQIHFNMQSYLSLFAIE